MQVLSKKMNESTYKDFSKILSSSIEKLEKNAENNIIYNYLKEKYDIRNATFEEIQEIAQQLYSAGVITGKEHFSLIFDYDRATQHIKEIAKRYVEVSPDFSMTATKTGAFGRRDWIAEFEGRAAKQRKLGNLIGSESNIKIARILRLLERQLS